MTNGAAALFMLTAYRQTTIYFGDTPLAAVSLRAALDHLVTWQRVYSPGFRPTYAHLSLIRTAHESAWLAYWLMEPGVDIATRLARGVAAQGDDYDERRKVEEAMGLTSVAPPAKLAADRLADIMLEATSRGLTRSNKKRDPILSTPLPPAVELFDKYEPASNGRGSYLYRVLSGYVHGKQWAATQNLQPAGPLDQARPLVGSRRDQSDRSDGGYSASDQRDGKGR